MDKYEKKRESRTVREIGSGRVRMAAEMLNVVIRVDFTEQRPDEGFEGPIHEDIKKKMFHTRQIRAPKKQSL